MYLLNNYIFRLISENHYFSACTIVQVFVYLAENNSRDLLF